MNRTVSIDELKKSANALNESKFSKGERILFCVEWASFIDVHTNSKLFSTAEGALTYVQKLHKDDDVNIYPVFDIWNNPKQVNN